MYTNKSKSENNISPYSGEQQPHELEANLYSLSAVEVIPYTPEYPVERVIVINTIDPPVNISRYREDNNSGFALCAIIGFMFSWIPIIGFLTFCLNIDAPPGTERRLWSNAACLVSSLVILFNIIFWTVI